MVPGAGLKITARCLYSSESSRGPEAEHQLIILDTKPVVGSTVPGCVLGKDRLVTTAGIKGVAPGRKGQSPGKRQVRVMGYIDVVIGAVKRQSTVNRTRIPARTIGERTVMPPFTVNGRGARSFIQFISTPLSQWF